MFGILTLKFNDQPIYEYVITQYFCLEFLTENDTQFKYFVNITKIVEHGPIIIVVMGQQVQHSTHKTHRAQMFQ